MTVRYFTIGSEAIAQAYAETEGDVVALHAKEVEQGEAVVVARLGRGAKGGACTGPGIDDEVATGNLIAGSGEQGAHAGGGAQTCVTGVVVVV